MEGWQKQNDFQAPNFSDKIQVVILPGTRQYAPKNLA